MAAARNSVSIKLPFSAAVSTGGDMASEVVVTNVGLVLDAHRLSDVKPVTKSFVPSKKAKATTDLIFYISIKDLNGLCVT